MHYFMYFSLLFGTSWPRNESDSTFLWWKKESWTSIGTAEFQFHLEKFRAEWMRFTSVNQKKKKKFRVNLFDRNLIQTTCVATQENRTHDVSHTLCEISSWILGDDTLVDDMIKVFSLWKLIRSFDGPLRFRRYQQPTQFILHLIGTHKMR